VLQEIAVTPLLTVREVVTRNTAHDDHSRGVGEVAAPVGLQDTVDARVHTLSGGQQRRPDLAPGVVGRPSPLLLDPPSPSRSTASSAPRPSARSA